jgi:UDP-GlcNAc:undecaprenyl-phosphate GlcNAc-1-phosphate transferase
MGDTGAMLIGLLLAYAPISSLASLDPGSLTNYASGTAINRFGAILPLLLPAAIMLIPYADLLMAVIRRARKGMSPFAPDRKHLHHRMLDIGHSHRTSVLIMYLWAALFAGSVVWLSIAQTPLFVLVIVTVGAMLALLFVSMPRLRPWARAVVQPATGPGAAGEGGAPSATASPTGAHARRPAARAPARPDPTPRAPARPDPTPRAPARPDPTPAPPAPAHRSSARPAARAATSPSGPAGSAAWLPAPPPPQAALHPAAPDMAPGAGPAVGSPEGQLASWPGGPQQSSPPGPPAPQESAPWSATPSPSSPPYPGGLAGSSPPWPPAPPAPPAPSTRPKP